MAPRINDYGFGYIVVDGVRYGRDLIILPGKVIPNWWRKEGHRIELEDLKEVLGIDLEYIVIGTGYFGRVEVSEEVKRELEEKGVKLVVADSRVAWKKYNEFIDKGVKVCGAFHLTC
ncbi:MAG: MTH938/NDUFAF3 family protein [Nitrososphaerota archaeon]